MLLEIYNNIFSQLLIVKNSRPVSVQACSLLNSNDDMFSNPSGRSISDGKCRTGRQT